MNESIDLLNKLFHKFQQLAKGYENYIGNGLSDLNQDAVIIFRDSIPNCLYNFFPKKNYKIKGSLGQGRIARTPWIAIMNEAETDSTQRGIYLVFLFSKDLSKIYLTLNQGVTDTSEIELLKSRNEIRANLNCFNSLLCENNDLDLDNEKYKISSIYSCLWSLDNSTLAFEQLQAFKSAYSNYLKNKNNEINSVESIDDKSRNNPIKFSVYSLIRAIKQTGLLYDDTLIKRFAFSLLSKRFLILSGLAGSGKTQLALAFAQALIQNKSQLCVVSVGADWTNREPLLGFPNALQENKYIKPESGVLDLLIEANNNEKKPYFLILDEMNMSYVERYFADFLSAMESGENIQLWNGDDFTQAPQSIGLPKNLFIIGTINVDETTYMFSPKVLDRANVIEFKISTDEMEQFLLDLKPVDRNGIFSKASDMGESFVELAANTELADNTEEIRMTLNSFFVTLKSVNAEFGYRSATEIYRFVNQAQLCDDTAQKLDMNQILDFVIVQKLLPKLHGSRKKLEPVLHALWKLCFDGANGEMGITKELVSDAKFPNAADKIQRMYEAAYANGFTSFAEA